MRLWSTSLLIFSFQLVSANEKHKSDGVVVGSSDQHVSRKTLPKKDAAMSKDTQVQVVYPYVADSKGRYVSSLGDLDWQPSWSTGTLAKRSRFQVRRHRGRSSVKLYLAIKLRNERLLLSLRSNRKLVPRWRHSPFQENQDGRHWCYWVGKVRKHKDSLVAISNCNGLNGLIRTSRADYFIEPMTGSDGNAHVLYRPQWKNISLQNDQVTEPLTRRHRRSSHNNTSAPKNKTRYLETLVATDHTVINFHGSKQVTHYLLTLLNIVSAVYADPSLGANFKIIVVKVVLLEKGKGVKIKEGNSRASLETICKWGHDIQKANNRTETHDITIFITRLDLGGPAGFAPVSGICTQRRSCLITRDEGLSSAFIIAHEVGHVLGMSHDGDQIEGNTCGGESDEGSVMAPMVRATFSRFHWSECSKKEFHKRSSRWECLNNKPKKPNPLVGATLANGSSPYTLDEQCRMEFGDGFQLCRSFKIEDHCTHLWCSSVLNPFLCKTKKGTPLEGTPCAPGKWCVNGACERTSKKKCIENPVRNNPRNGGWSDWSTHSHCSRTCGVGVRFRERYCNNPEPAFGGKHCRGPEEDFQLCNKQKCQPVTDSRAEQCARVHQVQYLNRHQMKQRWRPYITTNSSLQCKLACESTRTGEVILTDENVIDGTLCSYNNSHDICIQGRCQAMGCDKVLGSRQVDDTCGVCTGDGTKCQTIKKNYSKIPPKILSRVAVLPKGSRRIVVTKEKEVSYFFVLHCRRSRQRLLNVNLTRGPSHAFVALGTKFTYEENGGNEVIVAPGPLLDEVIVQIYGSERKSPVKVSTNYVLPESRELDSVIPPKDIFVWEEGEWTRCTRNCGGGVKFKSYRCRDSRTGAVVKKRDCNLASKPTRKEPCNNFTCEYRWSVGEWEFCSHACGSEGTQIRELRCVLVNGKFSKTKLVPRTLCQDPQPEEKQSCNRQPCPAHWEVGPWSPCSTTCSEGTRTRNVTCVPPQNEVFYECTEDKPRDMEPCYEKKCKPICVADASIYCKFEIALHYCFLPGIRELCCVSCNEKSSKVAK